MKVLRTTAFLAALLTPWLAVSPADPAMAATPKSLTGQAAYKCEIDTPPAGAGEHDVSVQMQLNLPASLAPGQSIALTGTFTMQFPEELRQTAQLLGVNTTDGYLPNLTVVSTVNGKATKVRANRFQTSPTKLGNPMQISGPISFPAFTIPTNAKGSIQLQLPQNGTVPRSVKQTPVAVVAFTGVSRSTGPVGTLTSKVDCYFVRPNPAIIGRIPIATTQASTNAAGPKSTTSPGASSTPTPSAQAPVAASGSPQQPPGSVVSSGVQIGTVAGNGVAQDAPVLASAPAIQSGESTSQSGVYVPTALLVLLGFGICLGSLAYAFVTNQRLKGMRRAIDG